MKIIKILVLLFILSFSKSEAFAQSELFGKWNVSCLVERSSQGSIEMCNICPTSVADGKSFTVEEFMMEIDKEGIKIFKNEKSTSYNYTWDGSQDAISFKYEGIQFLFKVLKGHSDKSYVLKDAKCGILLITKI